MGSLPNNQHFFHVTHTVLKETPITMIYSHDRRNNISLTNMRQKNVSQCLQLKPPRHLAVKGRKAIINIYMVLFS